MFSTFGFFKAQTVCQLPNSHIIGSVKYSIDSTIHTLLVLQGKKNKITRMTIGISLLCPTVQ